MINRRPVHTSMSRIRTIETDPEYIGTLAEVRMTFTTVRVQIRVWGRWITIMKWERVC